jgi:hypothetical protein
MSSGGRTDRLALHRLGSASNRELASWSLAEGRQGAHQLNLAERAAVIRGASKTLLAK